jgi:ABC-type antimicrobial peptide transport system ATPase subunit
MNGFTGEELEESHRALSSLLHKCKRSQEKLTKDTWQWRLMENNIRAIEVTLPIITSPGINDFTKDDLELAFQTLTSTLDRTEKIREKLKQGTAQWTLNKNRIKALKTALSLIAKSLKKNKGI